MAGRNFLKRGGHIVQDPGARTSSGLGHHRLAGIDRNDDIWPRRTQSLDNRDSPSEFGGLVDRNSARAGRLTTNIKKVGALLKELEAMGHRSIEGVMVATIAERVGRDIDHAHDLGSHGASLRSVRGSASPRRGLRRSLGRCPSPPT